MLADQGIAGTWGDLGEPEVHPADALHWLSDVGIEATGDEIHNAYGHVWTRMVYENHIAHDALRIRRNAALRHYPVDR
jgi:oligosaccharide 4-alpha-D-glucosyltransferase